MSAGGHTATLRLLKKRELAARAAERRIAQQHGSQQPPPECAQQGQMQAQALAPAQTAQTQTQPQSQQLGAGASPSLNCNTSACKDHEGHVSSAAHDACCASDGNGARDFNPPAHHATENAPSRHAAATPGAEPSWACHAVVTGQSCREQLPRACGTGPPIFDCPGLGGGSFQPPELLRSNWAAISAHPAVQEAMKHMRGEYAAWVDTQRRILRRFAGRGVGGGWDPGAAVHEIAAADGRSTGSRSGSRSGSGSGSGNDSGTGSSIGSGCADEAAATGLGKRDSCGVGDDRQEGGDGTCCHTRAGAAGDTVGAEAFAAKVPGTIAGTDRAEPPESPVDECPVCMLPLEARAGGVGGGGQDDDDDAAPAASELVVTTTCGHRFHLGCLRKSRKFHPGCPLCRAPIAPGLSPEGRHASAASRASVETQRVTLGGVTLSFDGEGISSSSGSGAAAAIHSAHSLRSSSTGLRGWGPPPPRSEVGRPMDQWY